MILSVRLVRALAVRRSQASGESLGSQVQGFGVDPAPLLTPIRIGSCAVASSMDVAFVAAWGRRAQRSDAHGQIRFPRDDDGTRPRQSTLQV